MHTLKAGLRLDFFVSLIFCQGCDFFRKYTDKQIRIRTRRNLYFQIMVTVFKWCLMIISCFFVIFLARRYADTQIRR